MKDYRKSGRRSNDFGIAVGLGSVDSGGARKMLQSALDTEVAEFIERMKNRRTEDGLREIVRNGYSPERDILSGAGLISPLPISSRQASREKSSP